MTSWLPTIKQLPFRAAFLAKLTLIMAEYGTMTRAARRMGLAPAMLSRWLREDGPGCGAVSPKPKNAELIDHHYFICWERREMRHPAARRRKAALRKAQEAAARALADATWQKEAERQAIAGKANFMEPPEPSKQKP